MVFLPRLNADTEVGIPGDQPESASVQALENAEVILDVCVHPVQLSTNLEDVLEQALGKPEWEEGELGEFNVNLKP